MSTAESAARCLRHTGLQLLDEVRDALDLCKTEADYTTLENELLNVQEMLAHQRTTLFLAKEQARRHAAAVRPAHPVTEAQHPTA